MNTMIALEGVEKVYRTDRIETVALNDIHLEVRHGEFVSVMGPSGCGQEHAAQRDRPARRADEGHGALGGQRVDASDRRAGAPCATARSGSSSRRST